MPSHRPDPEALQAHAAFVRGIARAVLGHHPDVEDVVQETWMAALRGGPDRPGALRAWLGGVARRQANLGLRRRVREERRRGERARRAAGPTRAQASVAEVLARAEIARRLSEAVLALPDSYRAVLLLRFFDDLPPRDVARRLELPVETVRTQTRRGLERLRRDLEAKGLRPDEDWRTSLAFLLVPVHGGVSAAVGTVLGALTVKKSLAIPSLFLLLFGGALLVAHAWGTSRDEDVRTPLAGAHVAEGDAGPTPEEGVRLAGRGSPHRERDADEGLPAAVDLAGVDRERDLFGVVTATETGAPIADAVISLSSRPWARTGTLDGRFEEEVPGPTVRSARDGAWRVPLEPGQVVDVEIRAPGHAAARVERVQAGERVDVTLSPGVALAVRTTDEAGRVLEGVDVRIWAAGAGRGAGRGFPTVAGATDAAGVFRAQGLRADVEAVVAASHPEHGAALWREARTPRSGTTALEIALPPSRTIQGRITDRQSGAGVAGARVGIGWTLDAAVTSDAEGYYVLPGWTGAGVYEIAVRAPGHAPDETFVGSRSEIDFALVPEDAVRGRVVDAMGRAVGGARIAAIGSSWDTGRQVTSSGSAVAAADGRFRIGELRHDMPHTLVLVAPGHGRTLYDVHPPLEAGGTVDLGDVPLQGAARIVGHVVGADGTTIARVPVTLTGANDDRTLFSDGRPALDHRYGSEEERFTDDLGRFQFPEIAPGTYRIQVELPGGRRLTREVVLPAIGAVGRADFEVGEGRRFTVHVVDAQDRGLDQVSVLLGIAQGGTVGGETDADGRVTFELEGDPVSVEVTTDAELRGVHYLDPPPREIESGVSEVRIRLRRAELIQGRVVDEADGALAAVTLRALEEGAPVASSWTRRDGTFTLEVPAGSTVDLELEGSRLVESGSGWVSREAFVTGSVGSVRAGARDVVIHAATIPHDGTVTVQVTDPAGRPLADAQVFVTGRGQAEVTHGRTDAEGRVLLGNLPRTQLTFVAGRAPRAHGEDWVVPEAVQATPTGQAILLAYRSGSFVRGVVVDAQGEPVAQATVKACYGPSEYHARTDEDGRFEARVAADAERVTLEVEDAHGIDPPRRAEVRVVPPGTERIRLVLE